MLVHRYVCVESPASTANLGPGFDVFGLALDLAYDRVEVEIVNERGSGKVIEFDVVGPYADKVPRDKSNLVVKLAEYILERFRANVDLRVRLWKGVKPRSGLGSSGASAAAISIALATLLNLNLSPIELVELAVKGEEYAAGSPHADNVAPSILGGFVVIRSYKPLDLIKLDPPEDLGLVVVCPEVELPQDKTKYAREILPKQVELERVIENIGNACYVALGFVLRNTRLIAKGMRDVIIEPVRARLIPGFEEVKRRGLEAGALAITISGAGPSIIAVYSRNELNEKQARNIGKAMIEAFKERGVYAEYFITKPSAGSRLLKVD